jgi:hypothetical protein
MITYFFRHAQPVCFIYAQISLQYPKKIGGEFQSQREMLSKGEILGIEISGMVL